jgi:cytochrome c oxidase assembly factor CtaG
MVGLSFVAALPVLVLLVVLATDLWVYADATANRERGTPVVFSFGNLKLGTPTAWFLACLLLWIVFFPAYIATRRQVP